MSIYIVVKSLIFCENTRHLNYQCVKRDHHVTTNKSYVERIWVKKFDSCVIDKEPKEGGFLILTTNLVCRF